MLILYLVRYTPLAHTFPIMPRFRKRFSRRRFRPRRNRRRPRRNNLKRQVKIALARSKPEKKYIDSNSSFVLDTVGIVFEPIADIAQGISVEERIGDRLFIRNLDIRWNLFYNIASVAPMYMSRFIWIIWMQNSAPAYLDIMESASMNTHYSKANTGHFKVLSDRIHICGDRGLSKFNPHFRTFLKIKKLWQYTQASDISPNNNRVFLLVITDNLLTPPVYSQRTRANYYDN